MPNTSFWWMIFSLRFTYFWIVPWQRIGLFYWSARHYVWWLNKRTPIKRRTKMYGSTNGVHAWNYMHEILCGSFCYGSILRLPQIWNRHLITYSDHIIKKWKRLGMAFSDILELQTSTETVEFKIVSFG